MWSPESLAIIAVTFLIAGGVKGVVGLGLPTISLALLTATFGLKEGMALMLMPSLVTNAWQGLVGGALVAILQRLWLMILIACVGVQPRESRLEARRLTSRSPSRPAASVTASRGETRNRESWCLVFPVRQGRREVSVFASRR